jgi:Tfp pilus assembly protein PilO
MIPFIGGVIACVLGIIGLVVWWEPFITMFKAMLPIIFILGGAVAAYIGSQEVKDKIKAHREACRQPLNSEGEEQPQDLERYRNEVNQLKERLAALEKSAGEDESGNKEGEEQK